MKFILFFFFYCPLKPFIHQCFVGFISIIKVFAAVIECYNDHRIQSIKAALRGEISHKIIFSADRRSTTKNN